VRDDVGLSHVQRFHDGLDIRGLGLLVEAAGRLRRQAEAAQVRNDHGVIACQVDGKRSPHVAGFAIAVQQNDRRPGAARADVDRGTVADHVARGEPRELEVLRR
jgi:hypothetical protein